MAAASIKAPSEPINFVPATSGEIIRLGPITCRVLEDGSRTDNRLGVAEFSLPPRTAGPPMHWHEMHDETFLTTQGTVRFFVPGDSSSGSSKTGSGDSEFLDARTGDFVSVPVRAPHTFANPFDKPAVFVNTFTPAFYINYFKLLAELIGEGPMTPEANRAAMARYATIAIPRDYLEEKVG